MGGAVSSGESNEELIDNLIESNYVRTQDVEKALRAVDRGDYYLEGHREQAYRDMAWKHGNLHLSAPCIYSEVLERLNLRPGLSFLNLGSGTGYLSTVAGLILGTYGFNVGVELHADVVEFARERLAEFLRLAPAIDLLDFCVPQFQVGNCLHLDPAATCASFDRVYCGAGVPQQHQPFIKNFVKVGGIAVMPCGDQLMKVERVDENSWKESCFLPVSFATLVVSTSSEVNKLTHITLPEAQPPSLQECCRQRIRGLLRVFVAEELLEAPLRSVLANRTPQSSPSPPPHPPRAPMGRIVIPVLPSDSDDDGDDMSRPRIRHRLRRHVLAALTGERPPAPQGSRFCFGMRHIQAHTQPVQTGEDNDEDEEEAEERQSDGQSDSGEQTGGGEDTPDLEEEEDGMEMSGAESGASESTDEGEEDREPSPMNPPSGNQQDSDSSVSETPATSKRALSESESGLNGSEPRKRRSDGAPPSLEESDDDDEESERRQRAKEASELCLRNQMRFASHLQSKLWLLPLPDKLKRFLTFSRSHNSSE